MASKGGGKAQVTKVQEGDLVPDDVMLGDEAGASTSGQNLLSSDGFDEDEDHWAQPTASVSSGMTLASPAASGMGGAAAVSEEEAGGDVDDAGASTELDGGDEGVTAPEPAPVGDDAAAGPAQVEPAAEPEPAYDGPKPKEEEDARSPGWRRHQKHVFILSNSGKPIYSRYGNEDKLCPVMGVMQALISFVEEGGDQLRTLIAGDHKIVFECKGPIILVMAACTGEPETQMAMQLNYVYSQLIYVLTYSQLTRIFEQQINFDLRRMIGGTEKYIDSLLDMLDTSPSFFLGAVRCLPLPSSVRDKVGQVLSDSRTKSLVFAILVTDNQLVALLRPKKYSLHPADVHLIFNNITTSQAAAGAELWMPLCLPRFNNTGFLHAHVSYVDEDCTTCLLLITNEKDTFFELKECRTKIVQALSSNGCLAEIARAGARKGYRLNNSEIPDLRHFIYKSKTTAQFTAPLVDPPYNLPGEKNRLFRRYQYVHHRIHSAARPLKIYYYVGEKETILGWVTFGFELYACFSPLVTKPAAINAVLRLIRWMKREEDGLFILSSLVF